MRTPDRVLCSGGGDGEPVEVRRDPRRLGTVIVRGSADPGGPQLTVARPVWAAFLRRVHSGKFDLESLGPTFADDAMAGMEARISESGRVWLRQDRDTQHLGFTRAAWAAFLATAKAGLLDWERLPDHG